MNAKDSPPCFRSGVFVNRLIFLGHGGLVETHLKRLPHEAGWPDYEENFLFDGPILVREASGS